VRNAVLRTHFATTSSKGWPYVQATMRKTKASIVDGSNMADNELADQMQKLASKQPYAHLVVSRSATSSPWHVQLKIHHALYDGVSLPLIVQQLQDLCNSADTIAPADILPLVIAKTSSSSSLDQRKTFWTGYLSGISLNHLKPPSVPSASRIEIFKPHLLPSVTALETQARKHGLTTQYLFLATYAKLYARLTSTPSSSDVVIGLYLANRSLPISNLHDAPVPTVNLVPLRVSAPQESDMFDVAAQIQYDIQEISAPANASVGLWEIAEWTGLKVDTFVNFLKLPGGSEDAGKGTVRITPVEQWGEGLSRVVDVSNRGVAPSKELVDDHVNWLYLVSPPCRGTMVVGRRLMGIQHALDIEATIKDGALDVGVFAPQEMMDLEEGEKLMEDIRVELEGSSKTGA
jgi:hypothetical protein